MVEIISVLCLPLAALILIRLIVVDLQIQLLPNILVLGLALTGFAFHASTLFYYGGAQTLLIGALIGGGSLFGIRFVANYFYKTDTLGLGDVKLVAAGGLWLGAHDILIALIFGALAGVVHGLSLIGHQWLKTKKIDDLATFSLPAGPGFIIGLFAVALAKFWGLPHLTP